MVMTDIISRAIMILSVYDLHNLNLIILTIFQKCKRSTSGRNGFILIHKNCNYLFIYKFIAKLLLLLLVLPQDV